MSSPVSGPEMESALKIKAEVEMWIHSCTKNWLCDLKSAIEQLSGDASLPRIVSSTPQTLILNERK